MSKWDVDNRVEQMAAGLFDRFYPSAISRMVGISEQQAFDRLVFLAEDDKLLLELEAVCPNCDHTVQTFSSSEKIPDGLRCDRCGEVFTVNEDTINPVFVIPASYRESVKKNHLSTSRPSS